MERFSPKAKGWELVSVIDIDGDAAEVCDVLDGASVALSLVKLSAIPSGIRYEMWADPTLRAEQLTSLVEGFFNGLTRAEEEGKVGHLERHVGSERDNVRIERSRDRLCSATGKASLIAEL